MWLNQHVIRIRLMIQMGVTLHTWPMILTSIHDVEPHGLTGIRDEKPHGHMWRWTAWCATWTMQRNDERHPSLSRATQYTTRLRYNIIFWGVAQTHDGCRNSTCRWCAVQCYDGARCGGARCDGACCMREISLDSSFIINLVSGNRSRTVDVGWRCRQSDADAGRQLNAARQLAAACRQLAVAAAAACQQHVYR